MKLKLDTINLFVSDMEKSIKFYNLLGLQVQSKGDSLEYAKIEGFGVKLCFYPLRIVESFFGEKIPKKLGHPFELGFKVESIDQFDAIVKILIENGIQPIRGPENTDWGQKVVFFLDPDENMLEIAVLLK